MESGGVALAVTAGGAVALTVSDGVVNATVETDPACTARLAAAADDHFVGVVADAGPLLASFVVDGVLCDGGGVQRAGWAWLPTALGAPKGTGTLRVVSERVRGGAVYGRALRTSEVVVQWRAVES